MTKGIVFCAPEWLELDILDDYVCCLPQSLSVISKELCVPILLRLGVPLDQMESFLAYDTNLPANYIDADPSITSNRIKRGIHSALQMLLSEDDQLLIQATIDFGTPRVLRTKQKMLPKYQKLGFATINVTSAILNLKIQTTLPNSEVSDMTFVGKDQVVEEIRKKIKIYQLLERRNANLSPISTL